MNKEQLALRARLDRDLLDIDQKIERAQATIDDATMVLTDLEATRRAVLSAASALRGGATNA